jgi:hypothetical protein
VIRRAVKRWPRLGGPPRGAPASGLARAPRCNRGRALHRRGYPVNISIIIPKAFFRLPPRHRRWCYPAGARDRSRDETSSIFFPCVTRRAVRSKGAGTTWRPFGGCEMPGEYGSQHWRIAQRRRAPRQTKQRRTDDPSEGCLASRISMRVWPSGSTSTHGSNVGASPGFKSDCRANAGGRLAPARYS